MLPPCLVDLWRFAIVAEHTSWQNKYWPDVDPNPPLWTERSGAPAVSSGAPAVASSGSPWLANILEAKLDEVLSETAEGNQSVVQFLADKRASGGGLLNC